MLVSPSLPFVEQGNPSPVILLLIPFLSLSLSLADVLAQGKAQPTRTSRMRLQRKTWRMTSSSACSRTTPRTTPTQAR